MAGFSLKEGKFNNTTISEEVLREVFNVLFSSKMVNATSYKFIFLKSIIDVLDYTTQEFTLSFKQIFHRFIEIYWILVIKYGIRQGISTKTETYVEQILHSYLGYYNGIANIKFNDLNEKAKDRITSDIIRKCKKYVVGALYEDTRGYFYSFSKEKETIIINPLMYNFLVNNRQEVEEKNYFSMANFLAKVNQERKTDELRKMISCDKNIPDSEVYRRIILSEFEEDKNLNKTSDIYYIKPISGVSISENNFDKRKDDYVIDSDQILDEDTVKKYLEDPESMIKKIRNRNELYVKE